MRREVPLSVRAISVEPGFSTCAKTDLGDTDGEVGSSSIMQRHICCLAVGHDSGRRCRAPRQTNNYKQCWTAKGRNMTSPISPWPRTPRPACETDIREQLRASTLTFTEPMSPTSTTEPFENPPRSSAPPPIGRRRSCRDHCFLLARSATLWFGPPVSGAQQIARLDVQRYSNFK